MRRLEASSPAPCRVCLIGDDADKITRVRDALADNAALEHVPDIARFRERLDASGKPDLILLDLPTLDPGSRQLLHELGALNLPVVALTESRDPEIDDRVVDRIRAHELAPEVLPRVVRYAIEYQRNRTHERELSTEQERLRLALKAANAGAWEFIPATNDTIWSDEMLSIYGLTRQEAPKHFGDWIACVVPEDREAAREAQRRSLGTGTVSQDFRIRRRDNGEVRWLHGSGEVYFDHAGKPVRIIGINIDITERKRIEQALHAANQSAERAKGEAERANQAKDQFLATLSHELRTPLTPVLAAVDLLQRRPAMSAEARTPLDIIRRNVQLQARLIDDLLDLTRIANGKLELKLKPVDLITVVERAVEIVKPDVDTRKLHFGVESEGGPFVIDADPSRIQQVIWNLLNNAVKFTPEGGCVGLRCRGGDGVAVIEVSDSGIGIEPGATERLFDAFEQGGRSVTRQFGGLGLGLAIARRLVQMHGGSIDVHSGGKNRGSTFRVTLPLAGTLSPGPQRRPASAKGECDRILLVEDNGDTAFTMKMLLETLGYQVEAAGDLKQALKCIESKPFDLLISDLGCPMGAASISCARSGSAGTASRASRSAATARTRTCAAARKRDSRPTW